MSNSISEDFDSLPGIIAERKDTSANVDVKVYYLTVNPNWSRAYTTCEANAATGLPGVRYHMWCRPQRIYYQAYPEANDCWNYGPCRRWLACHELGHTLGLQHSANSATCMYTVGYPDTLNAHDKEHLEDCYPHPTPPLPMYPAETRSNSCKFANQ